MNQQLPHSQAFATIEENKIEYIALKEALHQIPENWAAVFSLRHKARRVQAVLSLWEEYTSINLQITLQYMHQHLQDIQLIRRDGKFYMLYTIHRSICNKTAYYQGGNPLDSFSECSSELEACWNWLPSGLKIFYQQLHNGFQEISNTSIGLHRTQNISNLCEIKQNVQFPQTSLPGQLNPATTFAFFSGGMGGYIVLDLLNSDINKAALLFASNAPIINENFWEVVDEWIVAGFE